jgi:hypothetical protein
LCTRIRRLNPERNGSAIWNGVAAGETITGESYPSLPEHTQSHQAQEHNNNDSPKPVSLRASFHILFHPSVLHVLIGEKEHALYKLSALAG